MYICNKNINKYITKIPNSKLSTIAVLILIRIILLH